MNKKQLIVSIVLLIIPLICFAQSATNPLNPQEINDYWWDFLKTCNRHFWTTGDINNDGKEEQVGIFLTWEGEGWWSDDRGYVICIFDDNLNIVYGDEIIRFGTVKNISIDDIDKDGLKELVVSCELPEDYQEKNVTYVYKWDGKSYVKNPKP